MPRWISFACSRTHSVFFSARTEGRDVTPGEELAAVVRGTGVGLSMAAQTLSGLPSGLLANLATKVMCRLGSHQDYQSLGADMGMTPEQIQWSKLNLRPGLHIAQFAEGPWRLPFVLIFCAERRCGGTRRARSPKTKKRLTAGWGR